MRSSDKSHLSQEKEQIPKEQLLSRKLLPANDLRNGPVLPSEPLLWHRHPILRLARLVTPSHPQVPTLASLNGLSSRRPVGRPLIPIIRSPSSNVQSISKKPGLVPLPFSELIKKPGLVTTPPPACVHPCVRECMHAPMAGWVVGWLHPSTHPCVHPSMEPPMHPCTHPSMGNGMHVGQRLPIWEATLPCTENGPLGGRNHSREGPRPSQRSRPKFPTVQTRLKVGALGPSL